jgi:hypothetical protein
MQLAGIVFPRHSGEDAVSALRSVLRRQDAESAELQAASGKSNAPAVQVKVRFLDITLRCTELVISVALG